MIYAAEEVRARFARRGLSFDPTVEEIVRGILEAVREEGDEALDRFSRDLDGYPVEEVPKRAWREAYEDLDEDLRDALETARERIEAFYREEARGGFLRAEGAGCWPSSSAPWSGWGSTSPGEAPPPLHPPHDRGPGQGGGGAGGDRGEPPKVHPGVLAAAWVAGADRLFAMGGAQAIAALAYGTGRVPRVDKIVGPGNRYVVAAKRLVYGTVGIDGLAGPTETMIIADGSASPRLLAADLLAQAEHGPDSEPWLLSPDRALLERVEAELSWQLQDLPRAEVARQALEKGGLVLTKDLEEAFALANLYAPEHLSLALSDPLPWLEKVQNAGGSSWGRGAPRPWATTSPGPATSCPPRGRPASRGVGGAGLPEGDPGGGPFRGRGPGARQEGGAFGPGGGPGGHARSLDLRR